MKKILIAAPTSKVKDYCFSEWARNVKSFTYPNFDVLLIDNTPDDLSYTNRLKMFFPLSDHVKIDFRDKTNREIILISQNEIRDYFLLHNYDYLFSLETDIFPPVNTIEYLLSLKKEVCGLPYFFGQAFESKPLLFEMEDFGFMRLGKQMPIDRAFLDMDGQVKPANQPGLGCLLIKRSVIEKIPFRVDMDRKIKTHSDVFFHEDLKAAGIQVYIDRHTFAYHLNKVWKNLKEYKNF